GDVVGGGVGFDARDLAEVVDGVGGIGGAAADTEDEEAALILAGGGENFDSAVDDGGIEALENLGGFGEELLGEGHGILINLLSKSTANERDEVHSASAFWPAQLPPIYRILQG